MVLQERIVLTAASVADIVVWKLSAPLPGSRHRSKYRLAYIVENSCVVRFDNETGKGDYKHVGAKQVPYACVDLQTLRAGFFTEIRASGRNR